MKKTLTIAAIATIFLGGCAGNLRLLEEGKQHQGRYEAMSKAVEINIDGVLYKGSFAQSMGFGVGSAFSGSSMATGTSFMSDGSGTALLTSPDGRVLRCVFGTIALGRGQGRCQNNAGKMYDLLIGS